ncbi:hypothetical protein [Microbacterium sp.]|uniref:hypothetical protein n=1 Tax=Microbacterium sp. TaxID=51671 RepID=UPI003566680F
MDYFSYGSLIVGVLSILVSVTIVLVTIGRRDAERRDRLMLEEISLRETQLKYAGAVSARKRRDAVRLVRETLRSLDKLEEDAAQESIDLRKAVVDLRAIQYELLDTLLNSDEDGGEQDLSRLRGFSTDRRTELDGLRGEGEEGRQS